MLPTIDNFYERLLYAKNRYGIRLRWSTIAEAVGISKTNFSRYKSENYYPSAVTLLKIARFLGVDAAWLAGDEIKLPDDKVDLLTLMYEALGTDDRETVFSFISECFYKDDENGLKPSEGGKV